MSSADGLPRYSLVFYPDPAAESPHIVRLDLAGRFLPRPGDGITFDPPGGQTLTLEVTRIMHWFGQGVTEQDAVDVEAEVHENDRSVAMALLDPLLLIDWARPIRHVEPSPSKYHVAALAEAAQITAGTRGVPVAARRSLSAR